MRDALFPELLDENLQVSGGKEGSVFPDKLRLWGRVGVAPWKDVTS